MNIVLIGMPGCGKSTVGVVLAKTTGHAFLDTDLLIQKREGMLLQEIIDYKGLEYFMGAEEAVLCGLDCADTVVATGGSAVYSEAAMARLKELGAVDYLSLTLENAEKRLVDFNSRGIAGARDKTFAEIYAERAPLYEKYADFIVDCNDIDLAACMDKVHRHLELAVL